MGGRWMENGATFFSFFLNLPQSMEVKVNKDNELYQE